MPSSAREKNRSGRFLVRRPMPKRIRENNVPMSEKARSGFLPNLSENCPKIGVAKNCANGKIAVIYPSKTYPSERVRFAGSIKKEDCGLARTSGIIGMIMPNPIRSTKTVKNIGTSGCFNITLYYIRNSIQKKLFAFCIFIGIMHQWRQKKAKHLKSI